MITPSYLELCYYPQYTFVLDLFQKTLNMTCLCIAIVWIHAVSHESSSLFADVLAGFKNFSEKRENHYLMARGI